MQSQRVVQAPVAGAQIDQPIPRGALHARHDDHVHPDRRGPVQYCFPVDIECFEIQMTMESISRIVLLYRREFEHGSHAVALSDVDFF